MARWLINFLHIDTFTFKQFSINQNQNVHRIGTDGVLLGAWVEVENTTSILDIGTGTGVIALMLAQRSKAEILAIEPDLEAFSMAGENFKASPYRERMQIVNTTLQDFASNTPFDLIVSNPPFFENSLKSPSANRIQQRHTDTLSSAQLLENTFHLLAAEGRLAVILPVVEGNRFIHLAESMGIILQRSCAVFSKEGKPQERWLLEFSKKPCANPTAVNLYIMNAAGQWKDDYKNLTKDFYLNF